MQFSAGWCGNCEAIKDDLAKLITDNADKAKFVYIDIDEMAEIAEMYEVADLPTFVGINKSNPAVPIEKYTGSKMDQITEFTARIVAA